MIGINQVAAHFVKWAKGRLNNEHKERFLFYQGGTYAGKTMGIMLGFFIICQERAYEIERWDSAPPSKRKGARPDALKVRVGGISVSHLKAGALKDLIQVLTAFAPRLLEYVNKTDRLFLIGECEIQFFALDKPEKGLGVKSHFTYLNEANRMHTEIVDELNLRTDIAMVCDWNPTAVFWAHHSGMIGVREAEGFKHTYSIRKDVRFCQWNYKQNIEFVDKDKQLHIESFKKSNYNQYLVYGLGYLGTLAGVVYPKARTIKYFPDDCDFEMYGLDWGGIHEKNDPTAVVRVGVRAGDESLYCEEIYYGRDSVVKIAAILAERINAGAILVCDTNNPSSTQSLQVELGIWANKLNAQRIKVLDAEKGQGSRLDGINRLQNFSNLWITEDSVNLREEARSFVYKTRNGISEPQDGNDHLWDAARYAVNNKRFKTKHKQLRLFLSDY